MAGICNKPPLRVQENCGFIIDRSSLADKDDWLVTDLGGFHNKGTGGRVFTLDGTTITESCKWPRRKAERWVLAKNEYLVLTTYCKHSKYPDFYRHSTTVTFHGEQEIEYSLVQYQFEAGEHHISPKKDPRTGRPYIPTAPSTRKAMKTSVKTQRGPSSIYDDVFESAGGMLGAQSVAHLPRNMQQVKNVRKQMRNDSKEDEFLSLLAMSRETGDSCLKGLQWTPSPRVVFVQQEQMTEIVENCCKPDSSSVLSIDTTFNVGNFYVTSTSYQNRNFINVQTGRSVNVPGPAMFHVRQDASEFLYFSNSLLEVNYDFEKVKYVGGDRDKAQKSFIKPLKGAGYVPCKKHLQDNMESKMAELHLEEREKKGILQDIFGCEETEKKGLIDCSSPEEFDSTFEDMSVLWDQDFAKYFEKYIAQDMQQGMAPQIRRDIGLKDDF